VKSIQTSTIFTLLDLGKESEMLTNLHHDLQKNQK
jgi:hypothetical protein